MYRISVATGTMFSGEHDRLKFRRQSDNRIPRNKLLKGGSRNGKVKKGGRGGSCIYEFARRIATINIEPARGAVKIQAVRAVTGTRRNIASRTQPGGRGGWSRLVPIAATPESYRKGRLVVLGQASIPSYRLSCPLMSHV